MPPGPDGDDEELVEIDVEIAGPPPIPRQVRSEAGPDASAPDLVIDADVEDTAPHRDAGGAEGPPPPDLLEITDAVELQPPLVEASEDDPAAALKIYEAEAAAADGGRRGALLLEIARLRESAARAEGDEQATAALEAARAAFATDPGSVRALWVLRRLLARAGGWTELAAIYEQATRVQSAASDAGARADLLIARGRLLEDRLGGLDRSNEAIRCYREALSLAVDHPGALLSLLLAGARRQDPSLRAEALGGLARRAGTPAERAALVIEEAREWRRSEAPDGAARALAALEGELGRTDEGSPLGALLIELDELTRADVPAAIAARAVEDLAKRLAAVDAALAAALWRERAHLLGQALDAPEAALAALDEAARLDPTHPLVAAERLELALALDRPEAAAEIARGFVVAAARDDEAVDFALAYAETVFDPANPDAAVEILQTPRVRACRPARADLRALELALAVVRRDTRALSDAFAAEADPETHADGGSKVSALIAAAALRAASLGQTDVAADLYRRALDAAADPARARPALQALVALLAAGDGVEDAAAILESALASQQASGAASGAGVTAASRAHVDADSAFELWARESLVAFYADELGAAGRALPHQRRLVAMRPQEIGRRVRLCDLDLESGTTLLPSAERADNLLALSDGAGDPAAAIALRVAAGRALVASVENVDVARGVALLGEVTAVDPTGLAASALERTATSLAARAEIVAAEIRSATEEGEGERTRALSFRLAHHRAAAGLLAEAMAALTPLRSEGDPLARAWSYELGRRAADAFLEVAVLSEERRVPDGALGDEAGVLLAHGEALAEAGDPQGAADSFRRAVARAPDGETAVDAALGLFRLAAVDATGGAAALPEALEALAGATRDDPSLAAAAARAAALSGMAVDAVVAFDTRAWGAGDSAADPAAGAELTLLRFLSGARAGDARTVAEALAEIARGLAGADGAVPDEAVPLLGRAAARARLGGTAVAEAVAISAWQIAHPAALAPALTDLPVAGAAPWPPGRPDPRRSRARRTGGALGIALHLEAALDAERQGELGAALAAYGSVIALDPDRLEAWTGVRRVARAGGDLLGEARALARLGVLVRDPRRAAALLIEAGGAYEHAGRVDDAIAALGRAVELAPDDGIAYARAHALLRADLAGPGRAATFDGLLSYRLTAGTPSEVERIALLFERAEHRLTVLEDRPAAFQDFKRILKIDPDHVASLHKLAEGALADRDLRAATQWLERYLGAAGADDEERVAAAKLDLAASYDARGEPVRAIETLRQAALARPHDPTPLEEMSAIQLRRRDARGSVEALRGAAVRLGDPRAQAALALKIGVILRDVARDPAGAAAAFRQAADLDPLGTGAAMLVALHDAASDARGALAVVEREIGDLRRALAANPLDERRLERLGQWLTDARGRGASGALAEAEAAVENVRGLVGGGPSLMPAPAAVAPQAGRAFLTEIADPLASGFVAEVWPHLIEAAAAIYPPPGRARPAPLGPEAGPRVAWINAAAAAVGIPRLALWSAREAGAPPATPLDDGAPTLILNAESLSSPALRFHVGRALGLIAARAVVLERAGAADLAPLFSCAAMLAGAAVPAGLPKPTENLLRDVTRAVGRKDRKALALQASRFGFERFDLEAWRTAMLRAADRFGLLVLGDPALAAAAIAGGAKAVPGNPAAVDLLGFALGDRYPALRRAVEGAGR
jgi:tetratricopeptide (TPR) repeat protein